MKRTTKPKHKDYPYYGGRGIKLGARWLGSFENFLEDMGPCPSNKHSVDRIDNDGPYNKANCRWATASEQQFNTRRNCHITINGVTMNSTQWGIRLGVDRRTLRDRYRRWQEASRP